MSSIKSSSSLLVCYEHMKIRLHANASLSVVLPHLGMSFTPFCCILEGALIIYSLCLPLLFVQLLFN